jgi:hypothetical protein
MDRLSQLKQFAAEEPDDPFNQYALALEYLKSDLLEAARLFDSLIQHHPGYLPTYYPYAQLLAEMKDSVKAEQIYKMGIEAAGRQNDQKTLREIQAAYTDWQVQ